MLVRATYVWVLFFAHIPFVVNRTFNATPTERLQQYSSFRADHSHCLLVTLLQVCNLKQVIILVNKTVLLCLHQIILLIHLNIFVAVEKIFVTPTLLLFCQLLP